MKSPCTNCGGPRLQVVRTARPRGSRRAAKYCGYRDWCVRCYRRWLDNGKPVSGPPPVRKGAGGRYSSQLDDYEFLRSWGCSRDECATRLGVTKRTIGRYEAQLRERRETTITEEAA
jgi:hypothetical protein